MTAKEYLSRYHLINIRINHTHKSKDRPATTAQRACNEHIAVIGWWTQQRGI